MSDSGEPKRLSHHHKRKLVRAARRRWMEYPNDAPGGHIYQDWYRVMQRQGFKCFHCGEGERKLYQCRILPANRGGTNFIGNLFALCYRCKSWKHGKTYAQLRYTNAKIDRMRERGDFKTKGRALPVRKYNRLKAKAMERGFMRETGVPYFASDPDACVCKNGQAPHRPGSVVCKRRGS